MTTRKGFKSQDKSLRKQMIIDTAVEIFHRKGYRAATLDDVANELGLTRPAIYHYVSSKEDLLSQIYLQALASFFDTIYEITAMDLTPPEKLRIFVYRHLKTVVIENLSMFTVFFSEENQLPEKEFQEIRNEKRKFTRVVENILIEGMQQGYFRRVNPQLQANAIIGMCNWLYRWYKPGNSPFTPDEIIEQFEGLLEDGLLQTTHQSDDPMKTRKVDAPRSEQRTRSQILEELEESRRKTTELINELVSVRK